MKGFVFTLLLFALPAAAQRFDIRYAAQVRADASVASGQVRDASLVYENLSVPPGTTAVVHYGLRLAQITTLPDPMGRYAGTLVGSACIMPLVQDWQRSKTAPMQSQETGFFFVSLPLEHVTKSNVPMPEQLQFVIELRLPDGRTVWEKPGTEDGLGFYYARLGSLNEVHPAVFGMLKGRP